MLKTWLVGLELARDDDGALSDEGIADLLGLLTADHLQPALSRGDEGTVVVRVTIDAKNDMEARSAAERALRDRANQVWLARGLPPFTIAFIDAVPRDDA